MALILSAFFRSISMPLSENLYPQNSRLDFQDSHLFPFSVRPFSRKCSKTLCRLALCSL